MKNVILALSLALAASSASANFVNGALTFTDTAVFGYSDNNVVSCPDVNSCVVSPTSVGLGSSGEGYRGTLSLTAPSDLLFTFLGFENSSTNVVVYDFNGTEIFNTGSGGTAIGSSVIVNGSLTGPLSFTVTTNGQEISQANLYFLGFLGDGAHVIGLNDNTLATPTNGDSDFDDGVFSVRAVPVPTALPLMASALGAFGIARRRNKAKTA